MNGRPVESDYSKRRGALPGLKPVTRGALRVGIDDEYPRVELREVVRKME
jgi:hypothetical protein